MVNGIIDEKPDIIALQEINQTREKRVINDKNLYHYFPTEKNAVKKDNYAYQITDKLKSMGENFYWTWLPVKKGYENFDEGLSFITKKPIEKTDTILLSEINDYNNWKKRMALGVCVDNKWFYNVHFGWFNDTEEPFIKQWKSFLKNQNSDYVMGDFNNDASVRNQGYDLVCRSGFFDTYNLALLKDDGTTVEKEIDGWEGKNEKKRIDYIFSKEKVSVKSSYTIFNGKNQPLVSDHFGLIIEI